MLILLIFMLMSDVGDSGVVASEPKLLIFGGNGFIGGTTVRYLLDNFKFDIHVLSRGSWPFDTSETIKPHVTSHFCDRKRPNECLETLKKDLSGLEFDAVLDFSAYKVKYVEPFYELISEKVRGPYIYISTDSVYEVSNPTRSPISETQAQRPADLKERQRLNIADSYGHQKFEVEEFLDKKAKMGGLPYVFLRLPDVLGARDSTDRVWKYILWTQHCLPEVPLSIPSHLKELRTSYVNVRDVGKVVGRILAELTGRNSTDLSPENLSGNLGDFSRNPDSREDPGSPARFRFYNEAFNLGIEEGGATLKELLSQIAEASSVKNPVFSNSGLVDYFPSVTRGFLDISKARKVLNFEPSTLAQTILFATNFYEKAFWDFPLKRDENWRELLQDFEAGIPKEVIGNIDARFEQIIAGGKRQEL